MENRLLDAVKSGEILNLGPRVAGEWSSEREIPAVLIRKVLTCDKLDVNPHGLRIEGARITGSLDLAYITFQHPIVLRACRMDDVDYAHATLKALDLTHSEMTSISLDGATIDGDATADHVIVKEGVVASRAQIRGQLKLDSAHLEGLEGSPALEVHCTVIRDLLAPNLQAIGGVETFRTRIEGKIDLERATLSKPRGHALSLESAQIGRLRLDKIAEVTGVVDLRRSEIGELFTDDERIPPGPLLATGWRIQDMHGRIRTKRAAARQWLDTAPASEGFTAQPWHALADVYERNGQPADGRSMRYQAARRTTRKAPRVAKPVGWA